MKVFLWEFAINHKSGRGLGSKTVKQATMVRLNRNIVDRRREEDSTKSFLLVDRRTFLNAFYVRWARNFEESTLANANH